MSQKTKKWVALKTAAYLGMGKPTVKHRKKNTGKLTSRQRQQSVYFKVFLRSWPTLKKLKLDVVNDAWPKWFI